MRLSKEELLKATGTNQTAAQVRWFKKNLGVNVPFDCLGVIMNAQTFDALLKKRCGLSPDPVPETLFQRPKLNLRSTKHGA